MNEKSSKDQTGRRHVVVRFSSLLVAMLLGALYGTIVATPLPRHYESDDKVFNLAL